MPIPDNHLNDQRAKKNLVSPRKIPFFTKTFNSFAAEYQLFQGLPKKLLIGYGSL